MSEKEQKWTDHVTHLLATVHPEKVAKILLALNQTLTEIGFPFSPLELQLAFNELISTHLLAPEHTEDRMAS